MEIILRLHTLWKLIMIPKCLLLTTLQITSCLCQYMVDTSVRADVAFDDQNDRFDVTNIIEEQNRVLHDQPTAMDFDTRRRGFDGENIPLVEIIKNNRRLQLNPNRNEQPRRHANFAYDDERVDEADRPEDYDDAYERNLRVFMAENRRNGGLEVIDIEQLGRGMLPKNRRSKGQEVDVKNNGKNLQEIVLKNFHKGKDIKRRNGRRNWGKDEDDELMLGYAVPFNLQLKGYLDTRE